MHTGRFLGSDGAISTSFQPAPAAPIFGFMAWPIPMVQAGAAASGAILDLYRLAYEQAQAAAGPSWYERLAGVCLN